MMETSPRSIQFLLHTAASDIAGIAERARFLERIRATLLAILPARAGEHLGVAAYEHYRLRLHVGHGSWATRLRYMEPVIKQALAQRMRLHIEHVEVRVRPNENPAGPGTSRPRVLSAASRDQIRRVATYIDDPGLAKALERLANAGRTA